MSNNSARGDGVIILEFGVINCDEDCMPVWGINLEGRLLVQCDLFESCCTQFYDT